MAVTITYKENLIIGDIDMGKVSFSYLPLFDGKLEPYTKSDRLEVTESEPEEINRIIEEQKGISCQQLKQTH